MKQGILFRGNVKPVDVPIPDLEGGQVLIRTFTSCISAGTEISSVRSSGQPLIKRVLEKPAKVKKVFDELGKKGIKGTIESVQDELNKEQVLGYSICGEIVAKSEDITTFSVGDRVAAAGGGFAMHAEYVRVPKNLVTLVPAKVSNEEAATVALGAIAMQSVRRCEVQLGEFVAVYGTGLLGLLAIQMLKAAGARVIGIDINTDRLDIASQVGAEMVIDAREGDVINKCLQLTGGFGVDTTLFAAATSDAAPISTAFQLCRRKGKVVLLGVSPLEFERQDIYEKELDFKISTSYGPGRYDPNYELSGIDYPYGYVRWTQNRNMQAYLDLMAMGDVTLRHLRQQVFDIEQVTEAFDSIQNAQVPTDITFLSFSRNAPAENPQIIFRRERIQSHLAASSDVVRTALIGPGKYAQNFHLPNLRTLSDKYRLNAVISKSGLSARTVSQKYGAAYFGSNVNQVLEDPNIDLVLISTQHESHGSLVLKALQAGKHVFVEKPLATSVDELEKISEFYLTSASTPILTVGFNRRFSPHAIKMKEQCEQRINPLFINYRINAGYIPADHWVHTHGGRIVGEACHFIDFLLFLVNHPVISLDFQKVRPTTTHFSTSDNVSILLKFEDGSIANIQYTSMGSNKLSKERIEVFCDQKSLVLEDFQDLKMFGKSVSNDTLKTINKGQLAQLADFHDHLTADQPSFPIPYWQLQQTTDLTLKIAHERDGQLD